jgi:hypothetical protein
VHWHCIERAASLAGHAHAQTRATEGAMAMTAAETAR